MRRLIITLVVLAVFAVPAWAQKIEIQKPDRNQIVRVQTALNHLTVIEVGETVTTVAAGSLAVNERWKDAEGAPRERVEWFKIVCFGRLAEVSGEYLSTGRHVYLEGRLQTRKWEDRGGEKRTAIEVVANQMQILDRAPKNGNGASGAESSKSAGPVDEGDNPFNAPGSETTDQDIPV
jgi:single-strand DNA-binding protein